eukprot:Nitzschia sp. Nitz4//scaffold299_size22801//13068//14500//NITZ4_008536-RA/size22801-augustus-gene-0.44-mRNA-1//-1//CDS//3329546345//3805//frame0
MPKVKKIRSSALESQQARHEPLGQVIEGDSIRGKYAAPIRVGRKGPKEHKGDDEFLDPKTTKRILQLSKENELEAEAESHGKMAKKKQQPLGHDPLDSDDEEEEEIEDIVLDEDEDYIENDQGYVNVRDHALGLSAEDEEIVASMNQTNNYEERRTLADIIMAKIAEKESYDNAGPMGGEEEEELPPLPEKVVEVYTDIGKILSHYTSGKLPKAFKVIPSLSNWEQILYLTRPDMWTPHAMYAATRIFASNLNPKMAQRFYYLVLLDAVRVDIQRNKKLNYHYYIALKKAVYKPAAFFKGILLPLCKEECTLREAAIVASVLQRVSIPVHHSAVAIHKLAQMTEYNGAASIFIRTMLNKKYSLPAPVIASLVQHFASFINDPRTLPVLWHQALLVFVQRYKNEVKDQARESLRVVMKKHFHHKITPEIRRELYGAQAFKDERSVAQSDIMVE